jgi:hypothetical protein
VGSSRERNIFARSNAEIVGSNPTQVWVSVCNSRESAVGIATGYGLDDLGARIRAPVGSRIFSSTGCPVRLVGHLVLLSNGYWGRKAAGE